MAVHGAQQENEVIYEVLEKCAPKTGFPHSTELDWVAEVMALFREVSKTPAPDTRETEAANTP